jgi:hypothetical protein
MSTNFDELVMLRPNGAVVFGGIIPRAFEAVQRLVQRLVNVQKPFPGSAGVPRLATVGQPLSPWALPCRPCGAADFEPRSGGAAQPGHEPWGKAVV